MPGSHIPAAIARRLTQPPFTAGQFTPTQFASAADKAAFANKLVRFLARDCPEAAFTKGFYRALSNSFGHIAHYNLAGFYGEFFRTTADKIAFVRQTIEYPAYGVPEFTFCDVERAVRTRVGASGLLMHLRVLRDAETEQAERAQLERLKAKYEPQAEPMARRESPRRNPFDLTQGN